MATRTNFKELRQQAVAERVAEREQRGDVGQLHRLEQLGFGKCREADRLREKLSVLNNPGVLTKPLVKDSTIHA